MRTARGASPAESNGRVGLHRAGPSRPPAVPSLARMRASVSVNTGALIWLRRAPVGTTARKLRGSSSGIGPIPRDVRIDLGAVGEGVVEGGGAIGRRQFGIGAQHL